MLRLDLKFCKRWQIETDMTVSSSIAKTDGPLGCSNNILQNKIEVASYIHLFLFSTISLCIFVKYKILIG